MTKRKKIAIIGISVAVVAFLAWVVAAPYLTLYQMKRAAQRNDSAALSHYIDFQGVRDDLTRQIDTMFAQRVKLDPRLQDSPLAALGNAAAQVMAQRLVETYVTPEGIAQLLGGMQPAMQGAGEPAPPTPANPNAAPLPTPPAGPNAAPAPTTPAGPNAAPAPTAQAAPVDPGRGVAQNGQVTQAPPSNPGATSPAVVVQAPSLDISASYESFNRFVVRVRDQDMGEVSLVLQRHGLGWRLAGIELPQFSELPQRLRR